MSLDAPANTVAEQSAASTSFGSHHDPKRAAAVLGGELEQQSQASRSAIAGNSRGGYRAFQQDGEASEDAKAGSDYHALEGHAVSAPRTVSPVPSTATTPNELQCYIVLYITAVLGGVCMAAQYKPNSLEFGLSVAAAVLLLVGMCSHAFRHSCCPRFFPINPQGRASSGTSRDAVSAAAPAVPDREAKESDRLLSKGDRSNCPNFVSYYGATQ